MILVVGDINLDITAPLAAPPAVGEDCLSPELSFQCGGVGLNAALALARLGVPPRLVSCVGSDWFGGYLLEHAAREGIETAFVQRSATAMTGLMFVAVSPDGQRTFFGSRGANAQLRTDSLLDGCMERVTAVEIAGYAFLTESSQEAADELILKAKQRGIWSVIDLGTGPSRLVPEKLMQVMGEVDTVFANSTEAVALTRQANTEAALAALEKAGAREVVVKLGAEGCLIRDGARLSHVPPFTVKVVDTTGAGDAFTAGFMAARMWDWTADECALFANACGAAAATIMGAGERLPSIHAIAELLDTGSLGIAWDGVRAQVTRRLRSQLANAATSASRGA